MPVRWIIALTLCLSLLLPAGSAGAHAWRALLAAAPAAEGAAGTVGAGTATTDAAPQAGHRSGGGCPGHASPEPVEPETVAEGAGPDQQTAGHDCCQDGCGCGCLLPILHLARAASPPPAAHRPALSPIGHRADPGHLARLLRPPISA